MNLKRYAKYFGAVGLALTLSTGCTTTEEKSAAMSEAKAPQVSQEVKATMAVIDSAKNALAAADAKGYAWRDTGKIIEDAEKALEAGDTSKATSLALKAKEQAEIAMQQGMGQVEAVKARFN